MRARVAQEREAARLVRPEAGLLDGEGELDAVGHRDRRADLGDQDAPQPLLRADQAVAELGDAVRAELHVIAPVPGVGVERAARGRDRPVEVGGPSVRGDPGHLLGGRVDHVERHPAAGAGQVAVDEHPLLAGQRAGSAIGRGASH